MLVAEKWLNRIGMWTMALVSCAQLVTCGVYVYLIATDETVWFRVLAGLMVPVMGWHSWQFGRMAWEIHTGRRGVLLPRNE